MAKSLFHLLATAGCLLLAGCRTIPVVPADRQAASVRFTDVTEAAGIRSRHENGAFGRRYLVETMGSGCAFLDFDGDGRLDLLLLNGSKAALGSAEHRAPSTEHGSVATSALYRNNGDGTFTDVTAGSGLDVPLYAMGCCVGDYDNDRDVDLYISSALDSGRLFRNDGAGKFTDVTREAGVGNPGRFGTSCTWLDYDNDGRLDLFVVNYVRYSLATDRPCYEGGRRYYCRPSFYPPDHSVLYRNRGGAAAEPGSWTFEDVSAAAGIAGSVGNGLGVAVWDLDDDGWLEIVVANDLTPNHLFQNVPDPSAPGGRRFEEVGMEWGVAFGENARARAGMGIDIAEVANDGRPAILISNFTGEPLSFFRRDAPEQFIDAAFEVGVGDAHLRYLGFGLFFFDYDNDGDADAFVGNGHIEPEIAAFGGDATYGQRNHVYRNNGAGRGADVGRAASVMFEEIGATLGEPFAYERVTRGAAYGDYDNDGDLDILIANNGGPAELLRNDGGNRASWLQVDVRGRGGSGLGARVTVWTGDLVQRDFVRSGGSYCSESMPWRHFGLGAAKVVDSVEVRWPSGAVRELRNLKVNQRIVITE